MYKTAVISDEISQDLPTAAALAVKYGLDGLEIRSVNERNPFQMTEEDFVYVKKVCDEYGLAICGIGAPLFKCTLGNEEEYKAHLEGLERCIKAAKLWGTDIIRGFTFWREEPREGLFEEIAAKFVPVIAMAEENDITIVLESEPSVNTDNMRSLYDFITLLGSERVQALLDPGNEVSDPACPPPYPVGYELLKPYLKHIHLKDALVTKAGSFYEPALIGQGDVDYHGLIERLKADGYDGWVSVETHYRMKKSFDEEQLSRPQGSSFSDGGYEATSAYLDILRDEFDWMGKGGKI